MNIEIVDCINISAAERAWKYSRNSDTATLWEILRLDLPVNEMPCVVMEIESTIIEREIISSMRDHSMWSRSSRVDDPLEFEISKSLKKKEPVYGYVEEDIKNRMLSEKSLGVRQDEFRMLMPLTAMTKYTVSLNLRSLIKLYGHFKNLSHTVVGAHNVIFLEAHKSIKGVISFLIGREVEDVEAYLKTFKRVNVTPNSNEGESKMAAGFLAISATVPFTLRTHLIRHRTIMINDSLNEMIHNPFFPTFNLSAPIKMNIISSIEFWKKILETRSCWLTHYGIWKPIIKEVSKFIPMSESMLPCDGGETKCPFTTDNIARIEGNDPNPVCPIYCNQGQLLVENHHTIKMNEQVIKDARPEFWFNKIEEIK